MVLTLKVLILVTLFAIFAEDLYARSVHWFLFPLLSGFFVALRYFRVEPLSEIGRSTSVNLAFISLQLLLITIYFSLKNKKFILITEGMLGWGDILFLVCLSFLLPLTSFLVFYILSLTLILLGWAVYRWITQCQFERSIPLAGLQALLLVLFISSCWIFPAIDPAQDGSVLTLIQLWK